MVEVRRGYVDGRHGQIHLRMAGVPESGKTPLLCIHMSPMTGRIFERLMSLLGQDRQVVAFDTPGFGLSDAPPEPPAIEDYAVDLLAGLDALGITGAFDVMGYHTGSMTSVALSRLAPDRVRRIVMVSAPIFPVEERKTFNSYYAHREPDAEGSHILRRWKGFLYHHLRPGVSIANVNEAFKDALLGGEIEWWGHRAAFAYELEDNMRQVTHPVLVLNTGDDLDTQTRRAIGMRDNIRVLEVPGWGHGFLDLHTSDVAGLVGGFLDNPPGSDVSAPSSATAARYPERIGSFPPDAVRNAA